MGIRIRKDWPYYALFQFFWILVILPKAVQLLALGALMLLCAFRSGKEKPVDSFTILQLVFLLIYGVSIFANVLWGEHETDRILAAANTWLISFVALALYHFYRNAALNLHKIGKFALCNLIILVMLWAVYFVTKGNQPFAIMGRSLAGADWVNGLYAPRFLGYMDYANLVVFAVLFFYPLALIFLRGKLLFSLPLTAVLFLVVKATNSRTGLILYLLLFLAYFLFETQKQFFKLYKEGKYALFALAILAVLVVVAAASSYIAKIIESIMEMREGSNSMRSMIYTQSLSIMWKESPVIGIGIKDMLGDYPLGSHSTYIGVFYKAGILGGLVYMVSILCKTGQTLLGKDRSRHIMTLKICALCALLMMAFEDIDGANWCICIFFALLGLLANNTATITQEGGKL